MNIDDCFQLGYVVKVHGTKGGVVIFLDTDYPEEYYQMESVFIQKDGELIPFFIEGLENTNKPNKLITYFEEIETIQQAQGMKGLKLFLPLTELPPLDSQQFYYHEVNNFKIVDKNKGEIGTLKTIYEMPTNDMLAFDVDGKEIMIPLQEPIYCNIDKEAKVINVDLPDGYLDVFLSDPNQREEDEV